MTDQPSNTYAKGKSGTPTAPPSKGLSKLYVTPEDRAKELAMIEHFTETSGLLYRIPHDPCAPMDATIVSNSNIDIAHVECKWRTRQYATLKIDRSKVDKLVEQADAQKLLAVLLIYWEDKRELGFLSAHVAQGAPTDIIQRRNMRDRNDKDTAYDIPIKWFRRDKVSLEPWPEHL